MIFNQEPTSLINKLLLSQEGEINSLKSARDAHAPENAKAFNWHRYARGSAQPEIEALGINARSHHKRARGQLYW